MVNHLQAGLAPRWLAPFDGGSDFRMDEGVGVLRLCNSAGGKVGVCLIKIKTPQS